MFDGRVLLLKVTELCGVSHKNDDDDVVVVVVADVAVCGAVGGEMQEQTYA